MEILTPEEQAKIAQQTYKQGDYQKAAEEFAQAASSYQAQNNSLKAAEMRNNQSVALVQVGEAQAALETVEGTEQVFESESLMQAMAIGNRAAALDALDQLEEAESEYKRCAAMLKALDEDQLYAEVMKSISALQLRSGRQMEALANMQTGMEGLKRPNLRQRMLKKLLDLPSRLFNR